MTYRMRISRLTVDKLGVKLYDKVSAVIAELVSNSYDADATNVEIEAPMGQLLATKQESRLIDKGYSIVVRDNGIGMTPDEVNLFYLVVGGERRTDPQRGNQSKVYLRQVMGRKGVGKLAPFGICQRIEIISSGGAIVWGRDKTGHRARGHLTAHLILDRDQILTDESTDYEPETGALDGTISLQTGTTLRLMGFAHRHVPDIDDFARQMAQRFGLNSQDWKITLRDTVKTQDDPDYTRVVGAFDVVKMPGTELFFNLDGNPENPRNYVVRDATSHVRTDIAAGFEYDGKFYPITGWVAYSKDPYKDDLMAGVRIYCRGKIAAQTTVFNRRAGFTGEHNVRSYLVGELHADWLDQEEDLIQTDRRDLLWSHELGQEFEQWGQNIVKRIGQAARDPMKKKTWDTLRETTNLEERIRAAFPADDQQPIREQAIDIARLVGQTMREDEARDQEHAESIVQLSLMLAPHLTLDAKLQEAAKEGESPLAVVSGILRTARVAELSSFGRIADERVRVISRVETLKDDPETIEAAFQDLLTQAPWLIDPQWSPITANQSFTTLKREFEKYYKQQTNEELSLDEPLHSNKRADFVMSSQDTVVQIIEIKKPAHAFMNEEMDRLSRYVEVMRQFLDESTHAEFRRIFTSFHVTLVCDGLNLTGTHKIAFGGLENAGTLTHMDWSSFLLRTKRMHETFLEEADRQRRQAAYGE